MKDFKEIEKVIKDELQSIARSPNYVNGKVPVNTLIASAIEKYHEWLCKEYLNKD